MMLVREAIAPFQRSSINDNRIGFELYKSANLGYIIIACWLNKQKGLLKPKQFRKLLQGHGMAPREANKLLKMVQYAEQDEGRLPHNEVDASPQDLIEKAIAPETSTVQEIATASSTSTSIFGSRGDTTWSSFTLTHPITQIYTLPECPATCRGCRNYHGEVYNSTMLVCGIHASGWHQDDSCPDWQGWLTTNCC